MNEFHELLAQFIKFKSISTDSAYKEDINKTVNFLKDLFTSNGFEVDLIKEKDANPVILAEYKVNDNAKTTLIYGHYDVQPAQKEDGWDSEPFKLSEDEKNFIARGVVDNKGQVLIHIFSIIKLIKEWKLKYNIKFLIEGNEETAGIKWEELLEKYKGKLKSDYVFVSDGTISGDSPAVDGSFRGAMNVTLQYKTADTNLHSGLFGGAIPSASHELCKVLSQLYDENNRVNIPGFYDNVDKITQSQIDNNKKINVTDLINSTGVKSSLTEPEYDLPTQVGLRPTVQVTGLNSGYIGEGYANIVPSSAEAKINFRFVESQNRDEVYSLFENFIKEKTPDYVDFKIIKGEIGYPVKIDIDQNIFKEAFKILEKVYGKEVVVQNVGGSIPFIAAVKSVLGINTLSVNLANEDCNMHGINENFSKDLIEKGLEFSRKFFERVD